MGDIKKIPRKPVQNPRPPIVSTGLLVDLCHLILITMLFGAVYLDIFDQKPDMNGDNFGYILLGRRIAAGQGFTNATDIQHAPHSHFPVGYPALLALFIKTVGDDQDTFNYMNGLMMYGTLILMYLLIKRLTSSSSLALAATFITALDTHLLRSSTITMSEVPFLFMSMLGIYFFVVAVADSRVLRSPWLYLSIVCTVGCYYTRTTAIALMGGMAVYLIAGRDWRRLAAVVAGCALLLLPGYLRDRHVGSSHMAQLMQVNPYNPELGTLTAHTFKERIMHNLVRYISTDIPSGIFSLATDFEKAPFSYWLVGVLIICLSLWGIYRLRDYRLLLLGYIGGTLTILVMWPDVWSGIRFILPLIPIVNMLIWYGLKELIALRVGEKVAAYVPYTFLLVGLIYIKPIKLIEQQAHDPLPLNYSNYFDIAKWARDNTPANAIFSARKPDMFMYYAERTCIGGLSSLDDKEVIDYFRQNHVDYVIVEQLGFSSTSKYLVPAIQKNPDKFDLVYQLKDPDTYLLRFKR